MGDGKAFLLELLGAGDAQRLVRSRDHLSGHTPLMQASARGNLPIVQTLLEARSDVRARDWLGRSGPVCQAARGGHWDTVIALLKHGAGR